MKGKQIYTAYNFKEFGESKMLISEDSQVLVCKENGVYVIYERQ